MLNDEVIIMLYNVE